MQKDNYSYRITYSILIVIVFLGTIFYRQAFLATLLILLFILPPISFCLTRYSFEQFHFSLKSTAAFYQLPDSPSINFTAKNDSLFPFLNCEAQILFQNCYYPDNPVHYFSIPMEARKELTFCFPFQVIHPGLFEITLSEIQVTDYLHLFTFSKRINLTVSVPVYPKEISVSFTPLANISPSEDSDIYDPNGILSNDIRESREYLPGDRMQDIHWKLSARTPELMVKIFERTCDDSLVFVPEIIKNQTTETIETTYSLGMKLIREKITFFLALYHSDSCEISFSPIHDEKELLQALLTLYYQKPQETEDTAGRCFQNMYAGRSFYRIAGKQIIPVDSQI